MDYLMPGRLCTLSLKRLCEYEEISQVIQNTFTTMVKSKKIGRPNKQPLSQVVNLVQHSLHSADSVQTGCRNTEIFSTHEIDPYILLENDLKDINLEIREEIGRQTNNSKLLPIAMYYFDGQGKGIRPIMLITLMGRAINCHLNKFDLQSSQRRFAMIVEMLHTSSLIYDDIVDQEELRRGKPSINVMWNDKQCVMAGNFIQVVTFIMAAQLKNTEVTILLAKIAKDIIHGELMQIGFKETEYEKFAHYINTVSYKTCSLFANSLKAVAILGGADEELSDIAFQYGYNIGMAFQLIDDLLDFESSSDLRLGVITAPVLFASEEFPELNILMMRRFQGPGDVEKVFEMVHKSKGFEQTQLLAKKHCLEAVRLANSIQESSYQKGLTVVPDMIYNRRK